MARKITITKTDGNWTFGKLGEYSFEVKHYAEPSEEYGLDFDGERGRISKLWVRGWDVLPKADEDQDACAEIIRRFN